jgi:WD40 repeat protein
MMMAIRSSSICSTDGGSGTVGHTTLVESASASRDGHRGEKDQDRHQGRDDDAVVGGDAGASDPPRRSPSVPPAILVDHILPYLDRDAYECVLCLNREVYETAKASSYALPPPWPERTLLERRDGVGVSCVAFSPLGDGRAIACGCSDGTVYLWKRTNGKRRALTADTSGEGRGDGGGRNQLQPRQQQRRQILSIVFSPDEKYLVTGGADATIRVWLLDRDLDPVGGSFTLPKVTAREQHLDSQNSRTSRPIHSLSFFPTSDLLVSAGHDHFINVWDVSSRQHLGTVQHPDKVESIAVSPDGRSIASSTWDGTVRILDVTFSQSADSIRLALCGPHNVDRNEPNLKVVGKGLPLTTVQFSQDGMSLHGLKGFRLRKWKLSNQKAAGEGGVICSSMSGQRVHRIYSIALSPQAHRVAYAERDGTIRMSTLALAYYKADITRQLYGHSEECTMRFSPQGKHLVSGSSDGSLRLWTVI